METMQINSKKNFSNKKIKEMVNENFHLAELFEKYGIDFCCKGDRFIEDVLTEKKISKPMFWDELNNFNLSSIAVDENYSNWEIEKLIQHIVDTHHAYVRNAIPQISMHLQKVVKAQGKKYVFLEEVENVFSSVAEEMTSHMMKEERILFPLIVYLTKSRQFKEKPKMRGFGTVQNPIRQMVAEHDSAGNAMERIRTLTKNYMIPSDACSTFKVTYKELEEFEKDLHKHVHLENNILFPRAIELEDRLLNEIFE